MRGPIAISLALILSPGWAADRRDPALEAECRERLYRLGEALAAYQATHDGQYPDRLGDLPEEFLSDRNCLKCPQAEADGVGGPSDPQVLDTTVADPAVAGLGWEMSREDPVGWDREGLEATFYEFKQLQLKSLVGKDVPIVRCSHHGRAEDGEDRKHLNLTADGRIYKSGLYWECNFVDVLPGPRLFLPLVRSANLPMAELVRARPQAATDAMLDLRPWYNARFVDCWISATPGQELTNFIADLDEGLFASGSILFEPAGMVQLNAQIDRNKGGEGFPRLFYPMAVKSISLKRSFRIMHVLGGVLFGSPEGTVVARLIFHPAGKGNPSTWEWRYGRDVARLVYRPGSEGELPNPRESTMAWSGDFPLGRKPGQQARLFHLRFQNPNPDQVVSHLDFQSGTGVSAPFIAAVTLE